MNLLPEFLRKLLRIPDVVVETIEPQGETDDAVHYPDADVRPMTREDATRLVSAAYAGASPEQISKIVEDSGSQFEFDSPYNASYQAEKLGVPGRFTLLREWTWTERMDVLERAHQAWERNPLAKTGVSWTTRFAIGKGGTMTYKAAEVKEVLEEFIAEPMNSFAAYEREFCDVLQVDGEIWVRFFKNEQGRTVIIPIRPWHIQWITSSPDNYKEVKSYHYVYLIYTDSPGGAQIGITDLPVDEVHMVAVNRLSYEMRGRPDLFAILPWLKAYRDWLEERARLNRRKSVLYHVKVKNAQTGQVTAMQSKFRQPPAPGSIIVTNDNVEWIVLSAEIRAGEAAEDGRQIKLMAVAGMQLPEFYFADGANANLASATAQQLPALRKFTDYQDILTDQVWMPIFKRVLVNAIKAGRIKGEYVDDKQEDVWLDMVDADGDPVMENVKEVVGRYVALLKTLEAADPKELLDKTKDFAKAGAKQKRVKASEAFDYKYPNVEEKDPLNLAKALQIAVSEEWSSSETAAQKAGYDPQVEGKKIEAEAAQRLERAMQTPRGFNPDGTPLPPKEMAVLDKSAGDAPGVSKNGGTANGAAVVAGNVGK